MTDDEEMNAIQSAISEGLNRQLPIKDLLQAVNAEIARLQRARIVIEHGCAEVAHFNIDHEKLGQFLIDAASNAQTGHAGTASFVEFVHAVDRQQADCNTMIFPALLHAKLDTIRGK